ncbi:MAG TPA: AraC family transcriptional regulator [Steroidobacteraceae bacterium]|nr:AraC family transcriptional regulator [Steroidobacteraceae bacterium]
MKAANRRDAYVHETVDRSKGLFRTAIAGAGRSIFDAFANLERASNIHRIVRHPSRKLIGGRVSLSPEDGEGYWDLTQLGDEVYIVIENFAYKDPRVEFVPGDGMIQLYFKLTGDLTVGISRTEPLRLNRPALTLYRQPKGVDINEWTAPSARERCVAVVVKPEFLAAGFFSSSLEGFRQLERYLPATPDKLQYLQLPLSPQMFELADKLVNNPYEDILRLVFTEAVTMELLCRAVASFERLPEMPAEHYSPRDLKSLQRARHFLMQQLSPPPTIRQVARAAGMNETTLKRGFKAVFGETVFDFSVRCRMQHALVLLRDRDMPIARVAEASGYRHQTSFATAFGRHFGLRPKDLRRSLQS